MKRGCQKLNCIKTINDMRYLFLITLLSVFGCSQKIRFYHVNDTKFMSEPKILFSRQPGNLSSVIVSKKDQDCMVHYRPQSAWVFTADSKNNSLCRSVLSALSVNVNECFMDRDALMSFYNSISEMANEKIKESDNGCVIISVWFTNKEPEVYRVGYDSWCYYWDNFCESYGYLQYSEKYRRYIGQEGI